MNAVVSRLTTLDVLFEMPTSGGAESEDPHRTAPGWIFRPFRPRMVKFIIPDCDQFLLVVCGRVLV